MADLYAPPKRMPDPDREFASHLIAHQTRLRIYIRMLVPDRTVAEDILQQTNLVLWEKAGDFEAGTDFSAWASKVAYFEVLAHRQRVGRDRHLFSDEMVSQLAQIYEQSWGAADDERRAALDSCLTKLPRSQRDMLVHRYNLGLGVTQIAGRLGRPAGSVRVTLHRIRAALLECIERKLAGHV
jgi:RNA polymerase sigma-70 factor, ECF subfamily